jgi:prepilin-type N-terminal cleavage/methylation domain-containing protein
MKLQDEKGYTLIELIAVVVLLAIISSFFISRFSFSSSWSSDNSLRELRSKIEFVLQDSLTRQISYQIDFDLGEQSYQIWEIKPVDTSEFIQVDTLQGLRSRKEKERRAEQADIDAGSSIEEEFARSAMRDGRPLDELLYQTIFDDPYGPTRRIPSLEYPSISEKMFLPPEIEIQGILIDGTQAMDTNSQNRKVLYFSPSLNNVYVEIQLMTGKGPAIVSVNPLENKVLIRHQ